MRPRRAALLAFLLVMMTACVAPGSFLCAVDSECGEGGACEASGFCSFVDERCADGRRYGGHAAELSGRCVQAEDAPSQQVVSIIAGAGHNCALRDDGAVHCWGGNRDGALGDGTREHRDAPVLVRDVPPVVSLAAGSLHTCALDREGSVWCWGGGDHGQVGDGGNEDRDLPVPVPELSDVVALAAGDYHTCALAREGQVWCWGRNDTGQIGIGGAGADDDGGSPKKVSLPARLALTNAVALAADGDTTCARLASGDVRCWGGNEHGQLGLGDVDVRDEPVEVPWLADTAAFAVGGDHVCALAVSGSLACAGDNGYGQLGDGSQEESHGPVDVAGMSGAIDVAAGRTFSCARGVDDVVCWGRNDAGELGHGAGEHQDAPGAPVDIPGRRAAQITAGNRHACALDAGGCVWCWGHDELGQLGNGADGGDEPVRVALACAQPQ